jgi:hypothetical protein
MRCCARHTHSEASCQVHTYGNALGVQAMLDPGATAEARQRKAARKAAGRKRKLEDVQRRRGAGLPVKNRRRGRQ